MAVSFIGGSQTHIRDVWQDVCTVSRFGIRFMVFNATFNNISVILWRSVLLVKETSVPGENRRPVSSHWQTLSHNVVSSMPRHERGSISQHYWW